LLLLLFLPWAGRPLHAAGQILLILDDMGQSYGRARLESCFDLPADVAFSIIPGTPLAARMAARCSAQQRDYLAHLPWQPQETRDPAEHLLARVDCSPRRLQQVLEQTRRELPGMVGANNHQGSRACRDTAFLRAFAQAWRPLGLPFVDSRTVAGSCVPAELGAAGIAVFENQLFLDHVDEPAAIREKLLELERLARQRDLTIAIAHPRPNTLAMLEPWLAQLPAGLELIPASRALLPPAPLDWLAQVRPGWPGLPAPEPAAAADTLNQED
jgi:polysaccharide deacetylase 2 family uncharacterized protein YibQ